MTTKAPDALSLESLPRFALYLRPFSVTGKLSIPNPLKSMDPIWPGAIGESSHIDLETLLAKAFSAGCPLIGLGKPGEAVGAGRVLRDDQTWEDTMQRLAAAAELIVLIPAASEGTAREIKFLRQSGLLEKCLLVMPPSDEKEMRSSWEASRESVPVDMPPYRYEGMFYSVDAEGHLLKNVAFVAKSTQQLVQAIRNVFPETSVVTYKATDLGIVRWSIFTAIMVWGLPLIIIVVIAVFLALLG